MSLFSRFRKAQPVPFWAAVMEDAEFREFARMVRGFVDTRLPGSTISLEEGVIRTPSKFELGLHNVVQVCANLDRSEWVVAISDHLEMVVESIASDDEEIAWEEAEWMLMPRLFAPMESPSLVALDSEKVQGVATLLVLDLPTMVRSVSNADVERWGVPVELMWEIAMRNLSKRSPVEVDVLDAERELYALTGDETFEATHLLEIEKYAKIPEHGLLVCIPARHSLIWKPIHTADSFDQGTVQLGRLARRIYSEGPGSITPNLYWYVDGELREIQVSWDADKINIHLSGDTGARLAKLGHVAQNLS